MPASTSRTRRLLLVASGVLAALLAVEIGVRVTTGSLFVWGGSHPKRGGIQTDPILGRVIVRQGQERHPTKGFTISIGPHGTRLNGDAPARTERPLILAVGDSFAFGDGVSDDQSWPAVLERESGGRVINAGMIGFGVDQAVLRAEQLADVYKPDTIVLAFIPHDVLRCQMSYWSGFSKPYFELDGTGLRFHPAIVPAWSPMTALKQLLSLSMTLDLLFPEFLHWQGPRELEAHQQATEVACRLMERLAAFGRARNIRVVVLAHPQEPTSQAADVETKNAVLACARASQLETLDLFPIFDARSAAEREQLFDRHLSVSGYALVGTELARFLSHEKPKE